jgi:hypothetical protein
MEARDATGFINTLNNSVTNSLNLFLRTKWKPLGKDMQAKLQDTIDKLGQYQQYLKQLATVPISKPVIEDAPSMDTKCIFDLRKTKKITRIDEADFEDTPLNLPLINDLKQIPPALHWYNGDRYRPKGVYICLCKGFIMRIPFPSTVDGKDTKEKSLRCKYGSVLDCKQKKDHAADVYQTDPRPCTYVHKKERFVKIGSIYRCENVTFGDTATLSFDMQSVDAFSIKHMLMYSLSDDLLAAIWYQNYFKDGDLILTHLDIY